MDKPPAPTPAPTPTTAVAALTNTNTSTSTNTDPGADVLAALLNLLRNANREVLAPALSPNADKAVEQFRIIANDLATTRPFAAPLPPPPPAPQASPTVATPRRSA